MKMHIEQNKEAAKSKNGVVVNNADLRDFWPLWLESGHVYHYMGSLTTPPCTEGVVWYVRQEAIPCSAETIVAFRTFVKEKESPNTDYLTMSFWYVSWL